MLMYVSRGPMRGRSFAEANQCFNLISRAIEAFVVLLTIMVTILWRAVGLPLSPLWLLLRCPWLPFRSATGAWTALRSRIEVSQDFRDSLLLDEVQFLAFCIYPPDASYGASFHPLVGIENRRVQLTKQDEFASGAPATEPVVHASFFNRV